MTCKAGLCYSPAVTVLFLPLVLVLVLSSVVSVSLADQLPVNDEVLIVVSKEGIDSEICLSGSSPCHTLVYALDNLDLVNSSPMVINITYDQHIHVSLGISIRDDLRLIGNGVTVNITSRDTSLTFAFSNVTDWTMSSIKIEQFTFVSAQFFFKSALEVMINGCHFHGWSTQLHFESKNTTIVNSDFINCTTFNENHMLEFVPAPNQYPKSMSVSLSMVSFTSNTNIFNRELPLYIVYTHAIAHEITSLTVSFTDVKFVGNDMSCVDVQCLSLSCKQELVSFRGVSFENNTFHSTPFMVFIGMMSNESTLQLNNVNFASNIITSSYYSTKYSILGVGRDEIRHSYSKDAQFTDVSFMDNHATPIHISQARVSFSGTNEFSRNNALEGGAMQIHGERSTLNIEANTSIVFMNNFALLGGAFYISVRLCSGLGNCTNADESSLKFVNNTALNEGDNIFFKYAECPLYISGYPSCVHFYNSEDKGIKSGPSFIKFATKNGSELTTMELFPGQLISFNAVVRDFNDTSTFCNAQIILSCGDKPLVCESKQNNDTLALAGLGYIYLNEDYEKLSSFLLSSSEHAGDFGTIIFSIQCINEDWVMYSVKVNLNVCPLGYRFNSSQPKERLNSVQLGKCVCAENDKSKIICDNAAGIACVKHNYWYGLDIKYGNNITIECDYPYCKKLPPCPIEGGSVLYDYLPTSQDDQCVNLRGGMLCKNCQENARFTFLSVDCVNSTTHCNKWYPHVVLWSAIVTQFLIVLGMVTFIAAKLKTGAGYLYGPLFFLAILDNTNHIGYSNDFKYLNIILSVFNSMLLLNMKMFGEIPVCSFEFVTRYPLYAYYMHLIGILVIILVILFATLCARKFPKWFLAFQDSPVQVICLLGVLCFWNLTKISIELLKYHIVESESKYRVFIQPDLLYLKDPGHIVTFIILAVLAVPVVLFLIFLMLSQLLGRRFNLIRFKPFLDELLSCYKNKHRWFVGVYPLAWIILNLPIPMSLFTVCLVIICSLQFVFHPYKKDWINIVDSILLADSITIYQLHDNVHYHWYNSDYVSKTFLVTVVYIIVLIPLCCIGLGGVSLLMGKTLKKWLKKFKNSTKTALKRVSQVKSQSEDDDDSDEGPFLQGMKRLSAAPSRYYDGERESMIAIMQEEEMKIN